MCVAVFFDRKTLPHCTCCFLFDTQTVSRLNKIQQLAQRIALGALRTTPGTALAYDSNSETVGTCLDRKVTLSAIRLLMLPDTNPAGKLTKHALGREVM